MFKTIKKSIMIVAQPAKAPRMYNETISGMVRI